MAAQQQPRHVDVERRSRRRFREFRKLAFVARRPEPAPVAKDVYVDALAIGRALAYERGTRDGPGRDRERRQRACEPRVVNVRRLLADAYAVAALQLACEAGSRGTPFKTEAHRAQSMLGRGLAQCRAKRRTRCERAERAGQALDVDARRGNEFRHVVDPLRDPCFFLAPERPVMRGQARFDEHRFAQQRTELTGGALVLDAANLLRKPQIGFAAPVL